MNRPKDLNPPSRWNMRIWDDDKKEWLCQSDKDALTYYGFNITGGETTEFQGLPKWHPDRHLIWEQSTGLADKNGIEVYEGDLVNLEYYEKPFGKKRWVKIYPRKGGKDINVVVFEDGCFKFYKEDKDGYASELVFSDCGEWEGKDGAYKYVAEVIGNVHENGELVENSNKLA